MEGDDTAVQPPPTVTVTVTAEKDKHAKMESDLQETEPADADANEMEVADPEPSIPVLLGAPGDDLGKWGPGRHQGRITVFLDCSGFLKLPTSQQTFQCLNEDMLAIFHSLMTN